ncbi:hypothetical protein MES5069_220058 [Mesorhizobium escarrei]|uniref:Uncharacterized protein n=1 Tax=Mesorhizobium escarrei TaxID=666018 RepID=A0ABM9DSW2_9HYPH|nr:hypothetical protein MES5069_220058 [Mesorhizobium escarrei]
MVEPTAFLSLTGRGGAPPFPRFSHRGAPVKRCCHLSRKRCAKWNPRPIMRIPPLGHAASVRLVRVSALVASILGEIPHLRLRQWSVSEAIGR